jgi:hypothetical protein
VNPSQATYESKRLKDWARHVGLLLLNAGDIAAPVPLPPSGPPRNGDATCLVELARRD